MHSRKIIPILLIMLAGFAACKKSNNEPDPVGGGGGNYAFSYGDSVIYPQTTSGDYKVSPVTPMKGSYEAFPDGIELDEETGEINVSESETGLRYRITFTPANSSRSYTTVVLLAGINYLDAFYYLSKSDTMSRAVYNGDLARAVPVSNGKTVFDIDLGCNKEGIAINTNNGTINLMQTIRNGFFGKHPDNDSREEFELEYKIDDKSKQARQSVKIKLYYYNTINDVPEKYFDLLEDREGTILWANNTHNPSEEIISGVTGVTGIQGRERPRPPCIFIIGR
jgi:hypothetical protein